MRALPLWQPWASLVARGVKQVETRPRPAPRTIVGQRVAIHACVTPRALGTIELLPFREFIESADELPLGALVGTVVVTGSERITASYCDRMARENEVEFMLGHYSPGRWAWGLAAPVVFPEPIPWKGKQGIFFVPDEVLP